MAEAIKNMKKGLRPENLGQLQSFIGKLKKGELKPFQNKVEKAEKDLRRSGKIK